MLRNERILMTGPTSGVGFPVARALARDNEVYGLARFANPANRARLEAVGIKCIQADLAEDSFATVPDDFTYVLNFAVTKTGDWNLDLAASAEGPARLMAHCRKAKAWLHCSSGAVYKDGGHRPLKETDALADSHKDIEPTYSISKIAAEVTARLAARQWNLPTIIARFSVPYGNNGGWPAYHLEMILGGTDIPVHPDKPNVFNPIHEDDYVALVPRLFAAASVPATTVNIGGDPLSIEEWCTYIGEVVGKNPRLVYTEQVHGSLVMDLTRMHQLVGRTAVDWHDGLHRMIQARHPELSLRH